MTDQKQSTPRSGPNRFLDLAQTVLCTPKYWTFIATLVILADSQLCLAILSLVRYTEIDWTTYMQQVKLILGGQRNYALVKGDTGPLVYPAGHVYIYSLLYHFTDQGRDIRLAQVCFMVFYIASLAPVVAIYRRSRSIPPYVLFLLPLSKRLHSIYVLRLFNDGIASAIIYNCILAANSRHWTLASVLFSLALSIKMNILLFLPAFLLLSQLDTGFNKTLRNFFVVVAMQVTLGLPFLWEDPTAYLNGAFDFRRKFMFRWTVNWRFVGESIFSSQWFSAILLSAHAGLLLLFLKKWLAPHGGFFKVFRRSVTGLSQPGALTKHALTADYFTHVFFTCDLIGVLCSRSLHYQFYSWHAWQGVYLVWRSPYPFVIKLALLAATEWCWNVYPSTTGSSAVLFACNALVVLGAWLTQTGVDRPARHKTL